MDGRADGGGWVEDALTLAQILAQGERGAKLASIASKKLGRSEGVESRNRVCILWRLPVMPVTSSILCSSARRGRRERGECRCGEQGIFSFPYPVIISSSTSPPPPPPPTLAADENICCWRPPSRDPSDHEGRQGQLDRVGWRRQHFLTKSGCEVG